MAPYRFALRTSRNCPTPPSNKSSCARACQRLILLQLDELEGPVRDFLASLGKLNRPFLTSLESKMLSLVEEHTVCDEKAVDATTEVVFSENGNFLSRADVRNEVVK